MTELEKLVAEVRNIELKTHATLNEIRADAKLANTKLDAAADKYGQPLLDSRMTGAVYAAIVLVAILFGAKAF